jgi:hypothetical protein
LNEALDPPEEFAKNFNLDSYVTISKVIRVIRNEAENIATKVSNKEFCRNW